MTAPPDPAVSPAMQVVIVNYCTGRLTVDCLASLEAEVRANPALRVTVVDNASPDGSAELIEAAVAAHGWDAWAVVIRSPVNGGFAAGNNLAIRAALAGRHVPDLFWLLNSDTRVLPGAAATLSAFLARHPDVGIVGSGLIQDDGTPWPIAFRFPTILSEFERGARLGAVSRLLATHRVARRMGRDAEQVDWVPGASMVVRRAVLDAIGPMDDRYFLYFEETDFCLQARRAGWRTWYVPDAAVVHIAGQSTGLTGARPAAGRVPRYWFDSRRRFFVKNYGRGYAMLADLAWAAAHLLWRVRRLRARGEPDPPALLRDFLSRSALVVGRSAR